MKTNSTAPRITHRTAETGHVQSFSLTAENYDAYSVRATLDLIHTPVAGLSIVVQYEDPIVFTVLYEGRAVTLNSVVARASGDIDLKTSMLTGAVGQSVEMLAMIADLEQCAAIALVRFFGAPKN